MNHFIEPWVNKALPEQKEFRQAVHTTLFAITLDPTLKQIMVVKGGILLDLQYQSGRFTKDIDFSTDKTLSEIDEKKIEQLLNKALKKAIQLLDYQIDCIIQSIKTIPNPDKSPTFPSFMIKVGYAEKGTAKHKKLLTRQSPSVIKIDVSLNEKIHYTDLYHLSESNYLLSYSLNDLIAEKIRSLIQQVQRNRYRRQDVYDLNILIKEHCLDKSKILESLKIKTQSRNISISSSSLEDPEIKRRAEAQYYTLADEIEGDLPKFDDIFGSLQEFYRSLPW